MTAPQTFAQELPLSILHVCAPADIGGLERVVVGVAGELRSRGHRVEVAAVVDPGEKVQSFSDELRGVEVPFELLEVAPRRYDVEWRAIRAKVVRERFGIVHTHGYRPDIVHNLLAPSTSAARVSTVHGSIEASSLSGAVKWAQKRALKRCDAVIAVSGAVADELPNPNVNVVPNGWVPPSDPIDTLEARRRLGVEGRSGFLVGWIGRHAPIKGCDLFLEALARVEHPDVFGVIVGEGPETERLREQAQGLGLGERVRFTGAVPGAGSLLRAFDALALTSRSEGTPMVVLEAMGAGLPVIAFGVGGVPDVVRDGLDGWIADPGRPEALAAAIDIAASNPGDSRARGAHARERVRDDYGVSVWVDRYLRIYRDAALAGRAHA